MELRWHPNLDVSALHAAWVLAEARPLIDPGLQESLAPSAQELVRVAAAFQIPPSTFWRQLIGLAADLPINSELAERVMKRLVGSHNSPAAVSRLAAAIGECESALRRRFPNLMEELALRVEPLQRAWEARGPGLLGMMRAATEPDFLVESASIILVPPVHGGDGLAHLFTNRVHVEAMLTDVDPRLPEVLRLAWLLGQLNLDRPIFSDQVHGHALGEIAELALIPVVLSSSEQVQLAELSAERIELALRLWKHASAGRSAELARILLAWWETATEGQWDWQTRLAGLAQMIA